MATYPQIRDEWILIAKTMVGAGVPIARQERGTPALRRLLCPDRRDPEECSPVRITLTSVVSRGQIARKLNL